MCFLLLKTVTQTLPCSDYIDYTKKCLPSLLPPLARIQPSVVNKGIAHLEQISFPAIDQTLDVCLAFMHPVCLLCLFE